MADEDASEDDKVRAELVAQLRESLARSKEMMLNEKLDLKTREAWTQKHTNTAQVLNQILQARQLKDWEKRLRELEARGHIPRRLTRPVETTQSPEKLEVTDGSAATDKGKPTGVP